MKRPDCVCFGSMVFDYRTRAHPGQVDAGVPLRIVTDPEDRFLAGGIAILAMVMARLGMGVALMGRVGRDIAGHGLVGYLRGEHGIDTSGVRFSGEPTGYSVIRCTRRERYIRHYRGANAACLPDRRMMSLIRGRNPRMVAVGYAGLLPAMDADGGAAMARFLSAIRSWGILAALDTHTVGTRYPMLRRPLPAADVFVCNEAEARQISGEKTPDRMLRRIAADHPRADLGARRLLGVTVPDGAHLAYGFDTDMETGFVSSPWYTTRPADLTGAGDAFRAGLYSYLIRNRTAFVDGGLDWRLAGRLANLTAATAVTDGLEGVGTYPAMMRRCGARGAG